MPDREAINKTYQNDVISDQMSRSMSSTTVDIAVDDVEDTTFQNSCLESQSKMKNEIPKSSSSILHGCKKLNFLRDEVGNSENLDKPTDCVIVVETKTEEGKCMLNLTQLHYCCDLYVVHPSNIKLHIQLFQISKS